MLTNNRSNPVNECIMYVETLKSLDVVQTVN